MADLRALPGLRPDGYTAPCPMCKRDGALMFEERGERLELIGCSTCTDQRSVLAKVAEVLREVAQETKPIAPVWLEDFLLEDIPQPRWLLAPYIQAESVCVVFSAPNTGKTLWAFWAVCQMAIQGKSLVLEGEGSRGAFQRRLSRAAAAVGGVPSKHLATLHSQTMSLLDPRHEQAIASWCKGYDATLIDSLGIWTAGVDENDPVGMSLVGAALNRLRVNSGSAQIALAHSVKTAWKPGETPSLAQLRGHSALAAMVDTALAMVPAEAREGSVAFDLHVVKQRDEEKVKPRRYTVSMRNDAATVDVEEIEAKRLSKKNEDLPGRCLAGVPFPPGHINREDLRAALGCRMADLRAVVGSLIQAGSISEPTKGKLCRKES